MAGWTGTELAARIAAEAPGLVGFLRMLSGDPTTAEDLFQEVCLEVYRHRDRYDGDRPFGPWLRGFAKTVHLRQRRRAGRERSVQLTPAVIEALEREWERGAATPDTQRQEALGRCLDRLPASERELLSRVYRDGWSLGRVAAEDGRGSDAIKMLVSRLRTKLRSCIERRLVMEARHD